LLSPEEETALFRRMNFLKFKANEIRCGLDVRLPEHDAVERVEAFLAEAEAIRDRIVKANLRLVMSIVKKLVSPQCSYDEMLSDGIYSHMQAVEKLDYDRGFRFSTYAYRAITRNGYRKINTLRQEAARFTANPEESGFEAVDDHTMSPAYVESWMRRRGLLVSLMGRLDRRERFVIRSRYALGAHRKVRTFQCLANKLGVSKERVRQLEKRAVAKLKTFAAESALDDGYGTVLA
jgi:RNA polymerase primary sigma factor